ncbi:hypothetical protein MAR_018876 [Mya arenaria]|uniref:Uncharacterized protein n=1 Tax=Mya arenaria TaxID=6604 RepID=A0ABY7EJU4_MYAAR|nr:hypothetical protein MAR_018876 [Mya arenaria]
MAHIVNIEPSHPSAYNNRCQQHRHNSPADTISEYWRRNLYIPFVYHLSMELSDRQIEDGDRFNAQYLIPNEIGHLNDVIVQSIYVTFERDLPAESLEEFQREVCRWRNRCDSDGLVHNTIGIFVVGWRISIRHSSIKRSCRVKYKFQDRQVSKKNFKMLTSTHSSYAEGIPSVI